MHQLVPCSMSFLCSFACHFQLIYSVYWYECFLGFILVSNQVILQSKHLLIVINKRSEELIKKIANSSSNVCCRLSRAGFCDPGNQWQLCSGSHGLGQVPPQPRHVQEACSAHWSGGVRALPVRYPFPFPDIHPLTFIFCHLDRCDSFYSLVTLQVCAEEDLWWGQSGGRAEQWWHRASGHDEAAWPGGHLHQAPLLDSHRLLQMCLHGRRHDGETLAWMLP